MEWQTFCVLLINSTFSLLSFRSKLKLTSIIILEILFVFKWLSFGA